jgi:adenosylcobinamide kinase/adenosylcobinamide-phosphate guanylyltransferase
VVTLITGGCRSGKSARAITIACASPAPRKFFLATAQALDDEMRSRIAYHRRTRPAEFETIEEPINLVAAVDLLRSRADLLIIDCLTIWVANLLDKSTDEAIMAEADCLAAILREVKFSTILVTDEVGWGVVPENAVARRFRDLLGWTNQKIARAADEVLLMAAGYSLRLK